MYVCVCVYVYVYVYACMCVCMCVCVCVCVYVCMCKCVCVCVELLVRVCRVSVCNDVCREDADKMNRNLLLEQTQKERIHR